MTLGQGDEQVNKEKKNWYIKNIFFLFYSFVYLFISLLQGSVYRFIFYS